MSTVEETGLTAPGATGEAPAPRQSPLDAAERKLGRLLVSPGQLLLILLVAFPIVMEIYISLSAWTPTTGSDWYVAYRDWIWFDNFIEGLTSESFLSAVVRTVLITIVAVGIQFVIGFLLALLFVEKFPGRRIATILFLLPMMIIPAVSGFIWFLLLQTDGPINKMLSFVAPGDIRWQWLSDPSFAPVAVTIVDIWQWTPLMFLILLSGVMAVPEDQLNAANILGASYWHKLRHVILPIMTPIIIIALIIRAMEAFKIFDAAWLLTQGGPGEASSTISVHLYRQAFLNSQWSYVAALAIVVMIGVSIAAAQAIKPIERRQAAEA